MTANARPSRRRSTRHKKAGWQTALSTPWPWLIGGAVVLALGAALLLGGGSPATSGSTAADFSLPTVDGGQITLADHRGEYVLVNFWATWCPPCRAELPDLQAYYHDHQGEGFNFIAVNAQEGATQVSSFLQDQGFDFPVALDGNGAVMRRYQTDSLPSSYLIGPDGEVLQRWTGMISRAMLEQTVTPLLASLPQAGG